MSKNTNDPYDLTTHLRVLARAEVAATEEARDNARAAVMALDRYVDHELDAEELATQERAAQEREEWAAWERDRKERSARERAAKEQEALAALKRDQERASLVGAALDRVRRGTDVPEDRPGSTTSPS